ncbi:MAG: benzoate-CoA ligase family protein, partial [Acidimicrobiia bacterium]|nr:benzoate-CoA ligase family protein [Acidimicrobiia bacterium]
VPVPVNPLLPCRDVAAVATDCGARLALVSAARADEAWLAELKGTVPGIEQLVTTGPSWDAAFPPSGPASAPAPHPTSEESPGFWLCTSGSTGAPKLAMHRHVDLVTPAHGYAREVLDLSPEDVVWSVGPAFHAYGLGNSVSFPFSVGATSVLVPTRPPSPALVAEVMAAQRPTLFFTVPTFTAALLASDLPAGTFASVRLAVSAAEPLPAETYQRFLDRFGVQMLDGIGSTELAHIYCSNRAGPGGARAGTSGTPVGGYELRVLDEHEAPVPDGTPGVLHVKGDTMATGYWCRAQQSRQTFLGEWMRTGDVYVRSPDGFHTYLGRADDMFKVGGEWVSPAEVEAALVEHPDVLEAAVVGIRDDQAVVRVVANVVAKAGAAPGPDALIEHCRGRLAGFKRPHQVRFVDDLPKTATGKVQRFRLR